VTESRRSEAKHGFGTPAPPGASAAASGAASENRHLRTAIEFAARFAEDGQRQRPPLACPAALKPYLKQSRIPTSVLGKLRRVIEGDEAFRAAVAAAAEPELVGPIGSAWLRREPGWEERVARLIAEEQEANAQRSAEVDLRRSERQRRAAEERAARAAADLERLQRRVEELKRSADEHRRRAEEASAAVAAMRDELTGARNAARHASQRADAARQSVERAEAERDAEGKRAATAEAQRDQLLAERAERSGLRVSAAQVGELAEVARSARTLADRLGALVDVRPSRRKPLALPGGTRRDSPEAAEYLLRANGAMVVVDGYNVAKTAWPEENLEAQRERLLDTVDHAARRFGTEFVVVFDGAGVVGAHTRRRRLARVTYSPAGVEADDLIRKEVEGAPPDRPVVVVTNDQAVQRDVANDGANVVSSDRFLTVTRP
jgi:predicted RNA-binding protein with PIN domain